MNYEWIINDPIENTSYYSKPYRYNQFKWYLRCRYLQNENIGIYLTFTPFAKNIHSIAVKFQFYLKDLDIFSDKKPAIFTMNDLSFGWKFNDTKIYNKY